MVVKKMSVSNFGKVVSFLYRNISLIGLLVFILCSCNIILEASYEFQKMVVEEAKILEANISNVIRSYSQELIDLKLKVEKLKIKQKKIQPDHLRKIKFQPLSGVGEVLLLNKNLEIVSALYNPKDTYINHSLKHRDYLRALVKEPDKIQIDEPLIGVLTRSWAIPLAVSITDINNNFDGALIFSIELKAFTKFIKNRKFGNYLNDILFSNADLSNYKVTGATEVAVSPLTNYIQNIIFNTQSYLGVLYHYSVHEQEIILLFDTALIKRDLLIKIMKSLLVIIALTSAIIIFASFVEAKIISPVRNIISKIEDLARQTDSGLVLNQNGSLEKVERFINTFEGFLQIFQETVSANRALNVRVQHLYEREMISHNFFTALIEKIKEKQKYALELVGDTLELSSLSHSLTGLTSIVQDTDVFTQDLYKLSLECSEYIKLGRQEIDIVSLVRDYIDPRKIFLESDSESIILNLYKQPFEATIQQVMSTINTAQDENINIAIKDFEKICIIEFFPVKLSRVPSTTHFNQLTKTQLISLINNTFINLYNADKISVLIMK
jgi:hypothetical protein